MKKKFNRIAATVLFAVIAWSQSAHAQRIKPFSDWTGENPKWQSDESEIAYALTRCGILFSTIGIYFVANSAKAEDKKNGDNLLAKGSQLSWIGTKLAISKGMSIDAATTRHKKLFEIYVDDVKSNKSINNNVFYGNTGKDFEFCLELDGMLNEKK